MHRDISMAELPRDEPTKYLAVLAMRFQSGDAAQYHVRFQ
jgi:hypothetical protein